MLCGFGVIRCLWSFPPPEDQRGGGVSSAMVRKVLIKSILTARVFIVSGTPGILKYWYTK